MHRGIDRTDALARSELALLASHRLEGNLRILGDRGVALESGRIIPVEPDPVHLTAAQHLVAPDNRDVVLGLTGNHAGVAADAGIQIDRHAPLVGTILNRKRPTKVGMFVERISPWSSGGLERGGLVLVGAVDGRRMRLHADAGGPDWVLVMLGEVGLADDVAPLDRPVLLDVGQLVRAAGQHLDRRADSERRIDGSTNRVRVETDAITDSVIL